STCPRCTCIAPCVRRSTCRLDRSPAKSIRWTTSRVRPGSRLARSTSARWRAVRTTPVRRFLLSPCLPIPRWASHRELSRFSIRALKVFAAWLALDGLGPSKTIDRYLGPPGEGHVVHYFVGLDEALGASNVIRPTDPPPAEGGGSPFTRLVTLGLFPNPRPKP